MRTELEKVGTLSISIHSLMILACSVAQVSDWFVFLVKWNRSNVSFSFDVNNIIMRRKM